MSHSHRGYGPNLAKAFGVVPLKTAVNGHTTINASVKAVTVPIEDFVAIIKCSIHFFRKPCPHSWAIDNNHNSFVNH